MEHWWQHIRRHKHITLYQQQQTADSAASITSSSVPPSASSTAEERTHKAAKKGYIRKAEVQSSRTVELTDDGVLLPPLDRTQLPTDALAQLSFATAVQHHPTLVAVASSTFRRTLLGLSPHPIQPAVSLPDDERDSTSTASTYCALETLGKAGMVGLWQQQLGGLLNLSANNMHPLLFGLRLRQQITEQVDRGKNRVWLSGWQDRADRDEAVRQEQELLCEEWYADERRNKRRMGVEKAVMERWDKWRTAVSESPPQFYPLVDLQREEGDGEADPFVPELQHSTIAATDSCPANLSVSDYIYRAIRQSPTGLQMDDLRQLLPGQPVKSISRLMPALGESLGLLSVPDRKGRTLSYRFMTREQYDRIKAEEEAGEAVEKKEIKAAVYGAESSVQQPLGDEMEDESKTEVAEMRLRVSVMPEASAPFAWMRKKATKTATTATIDAEEQKEDTIAAQSANISSTPPPAPTAATLLPTVTLAVPVSASKSGVPLIVMQRRRAVQSLLTAAPSQLLTLIALNRSLAVSHPPAMDKKTATRFYDAMQCDGLLTLYTFLFSRQSGRGSHHVTVAGLPVQSGGGDEKAEEYERKRLAHEVALVQLRDSGVREKAKAEAKWDTATNQAAARLFSNKKMKVEPTQPSVTSTAPPDTRHHKRHRDIKADKQRSEAAEDKEAEASGGSSVDGDAEGDEQRRREVVVEVSRVLLGFIVPYFQRVHYLHRLLWSVYQQPPLPVVKQRSLPTSPIPILCFDYADVARRMRLSDFLLLCGAVTSDCSQLPFLNDQSLLDKPLDELPASLHSLLVPRTVSGRGAYRQLVVQLDILKQLHLIQPLAAHDSSSPTVQSVYSLAPSFTSGMTTYHFSSPAELQAYWTELRALATADKLLKPRLSTWKLPAAFITRLSNKRLWRYLAVRTHSQCAQLDQFARDAAVALSNDSSAAQAALLDVRQIERAAHVVKLRVSSVASYYARRLLPQLVAVHDELCAYEEKLTANKATRVRVKKEPMSEDDERVKKRPRKRKLPAGPASDSENDIAESVHLEPQQKEDDEIAELVDEEKAGADATTTRATRRARGTLHAPFTTNEDERLINLYNSWFDKRATQADTYLPFTFTAPPHIDTALDDGLAIRFFMPSASSMSVFAASFHTFLPLLSSDAPPPPKATGDANQTGALSLDEEKSTPAATGLSERELKRRIEYVLHDTPITKQRQDAEQSADSDEGEENEAKQPADAEQQERDDVEITHVQEAASRSTILGEFCAFASTKLRNRSARAIRYQLERAVRHLSLPLASTATASSVSTTGQRLLTSTPSITAYIAADPITASLLSTLKRIVLEPDDSYKIAVAHAMTEAYGEEQVSGLLAAMQADRWITRRKNLLGGERSWKVGKRASELLYRDESDQQAATQKESLKQQWTGIALGQQIRLLTPIPQLQVEAVMEGLEANDLRLPLPRTERSAVQVEERKAPNVDGEEEGKSAVKDGPVDGIVEAAEHAVQWDSEGDSVTLVNLHWRLSEQQVALQKPAADDPSDGEMDVSEDEADVADMLLVRLVDTDEEDASMELPEEEEEGGVDIEQQLCDELVDALVEAGATGLTRKQLQLTVMDASEVDEWDDDRYDFAVRPVRNSLFDRVLRSGLLYGSIVALPSFHLQHFAAHQFASFYAPVDERHADISREEDQQWATQCRAVVTSSLSAEAVYQPRALVSHAWRLLSGAVNQPLLSSLYSTVLDSVRRWPGVTEQRLCALQPVLTVAEVRHLLQLLVLDDKVHARWMVNEVHEQAESDKRRRERVVCYFPVVQQV